MNKQTKILSVFVIAAMILSTWSYYSSKMTFADPIWAKVGDGNFKSIQVKDESYLVNDREDLTDVDGKRRFGFKAINGLKDNQEKFEEVNTELVTLNFDSLEGKQTFKSIKINGEIVASEVEMTKSPDGSKILFDLPDGVWISDVDGANLHNIAFNGKETFNKHLDEVKSHKHEHDEMGEEHDDNAEEQTMEASLDEPLENHGMTVWWSHEAKWAGNNQISFMSNRDVFPDKWFTSIWTMDTQGNNVNKIIDGIESQEELNLLYADSEQVIALGGIQHIIYSFNQSTKETKTYPIQGVPFSVSDDGRYVLFNELDNEYTLISDISVLDLSSGLISKINHPAGYQVFKGAWSPDNKAFAFYTRETTGLNAELYLLDLDTLSDINVEYANGAGEVDPLSAISWINNHSVIVNMMDQSTWKAYLR